MDLMTLAAKIQLDDSEFTKGVSKAENAGKQLAGKMGAMTVAMGQLAAQVIQKGVQAITGVVKGAIDGYADYQQLIGGVETLFKESADKVASYAKRSYKTTGLSANQYMETVTGFSASLLQGLGGDTEKAADMANMAITDMADNANKMGTDISSIQAAYQGFAKQNYTMLDNLKLGYGGTREEMVRLINESGILNHEISNLDGITFDQIIEAIHKVQSEMGITGTTAKEASSTISGSVASLKASWEDLLAAMGGAAGQENFESAIENFKTSFSTYLDNFVPTLVTTISNSGGLVGAIADAIAEIPTTLMADIGKTTMEAGADMVRGVGKIANWLIDSFVEVFKYASLDNQSAVDLGAAIGDFLGTAISKIVTNAGTIFDGIVALGKGLSEGFVTGLFSGLFGDEANEVDKIVNEMTSTIGDAEYKATKAGALLSYMKSISDEYGQAATETRAWKDAVDEMKQLLPESEDIFKDYAGNVDLLVASLDALIGKMREAAIQSALQKALQDSYTLLSEQTIEYNKQKSRYSRNEFIAKDTRDKMYKAIQDEAAKIAQEMWDEGHDENGRETGNFDQTGYEYYANLAKGKAEIGADLKNFADLSLDELRGLMMDVNSSLLPEFEDEISVIKEAETQMALAKDAMDKTASEIEATKAEIQDVEAAVASSAADLNAAFGQTSSNVESGGLAVQGSLEGVSAKLAAWNPPQFQGTYMPEATGIDYVPYNGFKAELHRGETILTKAEADRYRNGAGTAEVVGAIQSLNNNIQNMQLVVGRRSFGRAVVGYGGTGMNDYIGRAESRRASGYGT